MRHGTTAPQHGTTALVRYFGSTAPCGTTVSGHGTTAPSRAHGGYDSGRGVTTPHTHSLSLSPRLSLSRTAPEALARSPSPATLLGFRPVGSFPTTSSCHGTRFLPKSLSLCFVVLPLGIGEMHVVLEILGQIYARVGCRRVVMRRDST